MKDILVNVSYCKYIINQSDWYYYYYMLYRLWIEPWNLFTPTNPFIKSKNLKIYSPLLYEELLTAKFLFTPRIFESGLGVSGVTETRPNFTKPFIKSFTPQWEFFTMPSHGHTHNFMSWTSHLKCKICKTLYDDYVHRPMILLECGHTICHMCTSAMGKKEGKIICPDDKTNMALNRVAPNLTLLQMLKRICTVCERIFGEELKEEPTEKKYFCAKCLDLLNKRKDEVKRNIWAKIAVIQKKNSEAVEAIQVKKWKLYFILEKKLNLDFKSWTDLTIICQKHLNNYYFTKNYHFAIFSESINEKLLDFGFWRT